MFVYPKTRVLNFCANKHYVSNGWKEVQRCF